MPVGHNNVKTQVRSLEKLLQEQLLQQQEGEYLVSIEHLWALIVQVSIRHLCMLIHFHLTLIPWDKYYYWLHFTDEKM